MRKLLVCSLVAALVLCFGYAAYAMHETMESTTMITDAPGSDPAKLYTYITQVTPYRNWNLMPGEKKLEPTEAHRASFMTCYVNPKALSSIKKKQGIADGSIIVVENYGANKKLESLSLMYKIKGYNPDAGDWFWVKYSPNDGYVLESGKVDACITCHASKKDNDYIHTATVKQ